MRPVPDDAPAGNELALDGIRVKAYLSRRGRHRHVAFEPRELHAEALGPVFDQVIAWGGALRLLGVKRGVPRPRIPRENLIRCSRSGATRGASPVGSEVWDKRVGS